MNLTYSLFGCQLIKLVKFFVWILKYLSCVVCRLVSRFICWLNCWVENFCTNGTKQVCAGCMCWCFFLSNKTKRGIACFISEFICCWARVGVKIVETFEKIVCEVMPLCYFHVLDYFVAVFILATTWVTKTIDWFITWVLCLTYLGDGINKLGNLFTDEARLLTLAPVVIVDANGDSDWFIHVQATGPTPAAGTYILGTKGELLFPQKVPKLPICDDGSKCSQIPCRKRTPNCEEKCGDCGEFVYVDANIYATAGKTVVGDPLMYYSEKVVEISDRLMSGTFADDNDSQSVGDVTRFSYTTQLECNEYNNKCVSDLPHSVDHKSLKHALSELQPSVSFTDNMEFSEIVAKLGDRFARSVRYRDYGIRVLNKDSDNCTNGGSINCNVRLDCSGFRFICNTRLVSMDCDYRFDINDYKFLMGNKNDKCNVLTVYFVNQHTEKSGDLSCADLLGYVFCSFNDANGSPKLVKSAAAYPAPATMAAIVGNCVDKKDVVGVAEELIHAVCHQAGLMHTCEEVDDDDMRRDDLVRVMYHQKCGDKKGKCGCNVEKKCGKVDHDRTIRRVLTPMEWCMLRDSGYLVRECKKLDPFIACELPHVDV